MKVRSDGEVNEVKLGVDNVGKDKEDKILSHRLLIPINRRRHKFFCLLFYTSLCLHL